MEKKESLNSKSIFIPKNVKDLPNVQVMIKRCKAQTRKNKELKEKKKLLNETMKQQKEDVAKVKNLENVSANEKLVVQNIIESAKKSDARGNRYTHKFVMLCMLMNIRSPGYYEFLREKKNYSTALF